MHSSCNANSLVDGNDIHIGGTGLPNPGNPDINSPGTGTVDLSSAEGKLNGQEYGGYAGAVAGVGDENGDGLADILVGASREGDAGVSYLVLGGAW